MELKEAITIVSALADGIDPNSGEIYPEYSPYQHPQVVRALHTVLRAVEPLAVKADKPKKSKREDLPTQAGQSWSEAEDEQLTEEFRQGMLVKDLAAKHGRTGGAIRARLVKLGLIALRADAK